jgi:acetylglutamate kinase
MEVTEMVLSGKINKDLVSTINQFGGKAVGLSGKDASMMTAHRRTTDGGRLGLVGEVKSVQTQLLTTLCESRYIPVISSIAVGLEGETLNINADEAAAAVAGALEAAKLVYLTDVNGILKDDRLIEFLELKDAEALLSDPAITGGMIPKLQCCIQAIKAGVQSVHIINGSNVHAVLLEIFTDSGVGTMVQHKKKRG